MSFTPTVSIIIAVRNARDLLSQTLCSIEAQNYPRLEVIVIDGNSTDGTKELIQASSVINQYISEPDQGISDAFNKGLRLATGDYINFHGAGDLLHPHCIKTLFEKADESYPLICGKVLRVQEDGITPIWSAPKKFSPYRVSSLLYKMSLPHQALFTHRSFFNKFGHFDTQVRFAMDYEILLRAYHDFPKTYLKDILVSSWRAGGIGQNRINEVLDEYHKIKKRHRVSHPFNLFFIDKLNRLKYQVKTKFLNKVY